MNVDEIATRVGEQLDFEPDLVRYKREVRNRIDAVYSGLCVHSRWPWLQRQAVLLALPDVTIPNGSLAVATSRSFSVTAAALIAAGLYPAEDAGAFRELQGAMVGGELDLVDRSLRALGNGNWEEAPFIIDRITPSATTAQFFADPRCSMTAITGTEGSFSLRFPRQLLPADVDELTAVLDEEETPLRALSTEEAIDRFVRRRPVNEPTAGRPIAYTPDDSAEIRLPSMVSPAMSELDTNQGARDFYSRSNLPIREDPPFVATPVNTGSNALLANTRYRFCICWWYAGRFGPPSKVVEITTTGTMKAVTLSDLPVLSSIQYGRNIAVFVAEGDSGPFILEGFQLVQTTATRDITTRPDALNEPWRSVRLDEVYPGGPYQYLRLWPRTNVLREMRVKYHARPRRLLSVNDEPEFKMPFHEYLVWATCMDIAEKHGSAAAAQRWQEKAKLWLDRLSSFYQPTPKVPMQKAQAGAGGGPADPRWPFANITIDGA